MVERDYILKCLTQILVDVLKVDENEVAEESELIGHLGIESIDFLDIAFRIESKFDFGKIQWNEIFPDVRNLEVGKDFEFEGHGVSTYYGVSYFTQRGIDKIRNSYPHLELNGLDGKVEGWRLGRLINVRSIVNYIETRLNQ